MTDGPPPLYGLDIETDTATGGLDPSCSAVIAVGLAMPGGTRVLTGPEARIITTLDALLAAAPAGVIATWNGGGFDLPFLAERAHRLGLPVGLRTWPDQRVTGTYGLAGLPSAAYSAVWHHHGHLDAYRLWRRVRLALGVSASLKSVAAHLGLPATSVDAARVHELSTADLSRYVASDAELAAELARRGWGWSAMALDPPPPWEQAGQVG